MLFYASLRLFNWFTGDPKWDRDFWAEIICVVVHRHHTALRLTRPKRVLKLLVLPLLTSCVLSPVHRAVSLLKPAKELLQCSLPAAPACEDLPLLRGTPAALTEFDG
jgi:hypothetical protein